MQKTSNRILLLGKSLHIFVSFDLEPRLRPDMILFVNEIEWNLRLLKLGKAGDVVLDI